MKLRALLVILFQLVIFKSYAEPQVIKDYFEREGNPKALAHLQCIRNYLSQQTFRLKEVKGDKSNVYTLANRCNAIEGDGRDITINRDDVSIIVDYTKTSVKRRFYILDYKNDKTRYYYVSHGRFGNTSRSNTVLRSLSNSIKEIALYSNKPGSNASSSGLHITGHSYIGKWSGADNKKQSMVLHGIEQGINDNSCARATVIHGNSYINENGSYAGVNKMSSGCPMLDYSYVNKLISQIRGFGGHLPAYVKEKRMGGSFYFVYGTREEALPEDYYCNPENWKKELRIK
jgi:hypothetical protein